MLTKYAFVVWLLLFILPGSFIFNSAGYARKKSFDDNSLSFSVKCNGLMLGYRIQSLFLLPGETITFNVFDANWRRSYKFAVADGNALTKSDREWQWTAPREAGMYRASLQQFICRQKSDYPKYAVIDEKLLIKLEVLINRLNLQGWPCRSLIISSAYRTPYYKNKQLGNVPYSRHLWGQAADILVDNNYNGRMDDLNKDGNYDLQDSMALKSVVQDIENERRHYNKIGGIGIYSETDQHGPFIHIDVRGEPAQW